MPLELVATDARSPEVREYEEGAIGPRDVRLRSTLSAFKHGTGLRSYRANTRDATAPFDWETRLHREEQSREPDYPVSLGNTTVGTVVEIGDDVGTFDIGDRAYGHLPIRETHTVSEGTLDPVPEEMSDEDAIYADPARVGLHVVRTGNVRLGDVVAVFGAGSIGQMAMQLARLEGARWIAVSEPIERRRRAARDHGADLVIDPTEEDPGERIKDEVDAGGEPGVDAALETSGAYAGLNDAVRSTAFGGIVSSCGYYADDPSGLHLEGEFHRNSLDIRSVRPPSEPLRDHPRWSTERLDGEAFELFHDGRLSSENLLDPVVPIEDAAEGMRLIDERPEESIKLGVRYDT